MGELETRARKKRRKDFLQRAVLTTIGVAGILAVMAVAPNTLQLLGRFGRKQHQFAYQTKSVLRRLAEKGHVRFVHKGGTRYVEITEAGKRAVEIDIRLGAQKKQRPRRWDKRWRLVMFDIPDKRKKMRDHLRRTMAEAGFSRLQDSVWIFPYDCEELIRLLKIDMHFGNDVRYAIVESLENDTALKQHFRLTA
jgi:DNA-binding transcriptional regulator PaaX